MSVMNNKTISAFGIILLASIISISGCGDTSDKKKRIHEGTFVKLYSEMLITAEMYRTDTVVYKAKMDSLLRAFQVTKEQVKITEEWYGTHSEQGGKMYEKVIANLEEKMKAGKK